MRWIAFLLGLVCAAVSSVAELRPTGLRCEYRQDPLGIDSSRPRMSWVLESSDPQARGLHQTAYQVLVATGPGQLAPGRADLWDSGRVPSDQMAHIVYAGQSLKTHQKCSWAVRVWDQDGAVSGWSKPAFWTMGVLRPEDWQARWISAREGGDRSGPLPLFRRELKLEKRVQRALASICGLGCYELSIDGQKVGDNVLDPGWTDYRKRCLYTSYDVTAHFRHAAAGTVPKALGVMLGNGMYNVRGGRYVKFTGSFGPPKFIFQLHLEFTDGTATDIVSDSSWKTAPGPITFSCIYGGEDYDARLDQAGWDKPGFDDATWQPVLQTEGPGGRLVVQSAPPIRVMDTFKPIRVSEPKPGVFVYDLGQNFSGWPLLEVRGAAGARVKLTPGELLDEAGLVSQRSSGGPTSFSYTLKGVPQPEAWHPRFSYYGFRYVQLEGAVPADGRAADGQVMVVSLRGQFTHSSARKTSSFGCSEILLNNIEHLIQAAVESNLQSVLTDCPHREKLGWLEVSHLLGPAIMFNYDVPLLYEKISDDMADAQVPNGLVPDIAPEYTVFSAGFRDSPEWGSACVINPWLVYQRYGDQRPLAEHYDQMARYVGYLGSRAQDHIVSHGLGDWYDIGPNPPGESQLTSKGVTATALYYQDIDILRQAAQVLGKKADVEKWATLGAEVHRAFNDKFYKPDRGQYDRGSQTADAMPLVLGLVAPERASAVLDHLVRDVQSHGNQVTAGDVGFRYLVEALRAGGRSDVLFNLITRVQGPGYADQLRKGATTLTEAWDANPASSQNHCMLGHAAEWFYTGLAGINPDPSAPGFRKIIIHPEIVGSTRWVRANYDSISGPIQSSWQRVGDQVTLEISIPPNTSATVYLPGRDPAAVTVDGKPLAQVAEVKFHQIENGSVACEVESGRYIFTAPSPAGPKPSTTR
jgi:alpha-L-rhamnosidase